MSSNIPPTIRAGHGGPSSPNHSEATDEMTRTLMSLSVALVARAGDCAATYAEHGGRCQVYEEDVKIAMQYQAKVFFDQVTDEEVAASRADVDRACDTDDTDDTDDTGDKETDDSDETDAKTWCRSACPCVLCTGMNEAHETWDAWAPEDEALQYLRSVTAKYLAGR